MRFFPGTSLEDRNDYRKLLLQKVTGTIVLHARTQNCVNETSNTVFDKTLNLKHFIKKNLPDSKEILK